MKNIGNQVMKEMKEKNKANEERKNKIRNSKEYVVKNKKLDLRITGYQAKILKHVAENNKTTVSQLIRDYIEMLSRDGERKYLIDINKRGKISVKNK